MANPATARRIARMRAANGGEEVKEEAEIYERIERGNFDDLPEPEERTL